MTRKEAIEIIDRNLELGKWRYSDLYIEALEMAIEALEEKPRMLQPDPYNLDKEGKEENGYCKF